MMEIVIQELPKATIVSVAHRVELEAFHSRKIVLERRKGGAKLVSDIDLIPRKGKRRLLGRFLRSRKERRRRRDAFFLFPDVLLFGHEKRRNGRDLSELRFRFQSVRRKSDLGHAS
jgi:hypothetical protein